MNDTVQEAAAGVIERNAVTRGHAPLVQHPETCLVCRSSNQLSVTVVDSKDYWHCGACDARYLDPRRHPSREAEHSHYLHHQNHIYDTRYRRFLSRLATPLLARLASGSAGLDYGCGPGPALAAMLREAGHAVALYDPFFYVDPAPLSGCYDFVTCTETAEHFHHPATEFDRLMGLVRPGGWLAVMTCFLTEAASFQDWHYRKDPTHVVFYGERTLRCLATSRGWSCKIPVEDVALMQRPWEQGGTG